MKKTIRIKNRSIKAFENEFRKRLLKQFYHINDLIANQLMRDSKVPFKDDSANDVLKLIDRFDQIDYEKLFREMAEEVREKLWLPLTDRGVPLISMSKAEQRLIDDWISTNTLAIRASADESKAKIYRIVANAYQYGQSQKDTAKELSKEFNIARNKSKFWANDMLGTLNAELSQKRDEALGVKYQIWRTTGDNAVRKSHREVDGKKFEVGKGLRVDGRILLPGEDYNCRCYGESVIEIEERE